MAWVTEKWNFKKGKLSWERMKTVSIKRKFRIA
jgi:hypothetical protein